jgi:hypothetical protein
MDCPGALIQAGARGVGATFWPVFGHVADAILDEFFKGHRMQNLAPAEAMRHAVLPARDVPRASAPLFKTAFRSSFRVFSGTSDTESESATRNDLLHDFSNPIDNEKDRLLGARDQAFQELDWQMQIVATRR